MKIAEYVVWFWWLGCCYGVLYAVGCEKLACFVVCIYGLGQESLKKRGECRCNRWERDFSKF